MNIRSPYFILLVVYVVICLIVAVTPKRYQSTKVIGVLLIVANRISILCHFDAPGTLQWPIIAKAILAPGASIDPK